MRQIFVGEQRQGGRDGPYDPEEAEQIFKDILEDDIMDKNDGEGERTGDGKGPGSPGGNEMESAKHVADEDSAEHARAKKDKDRAEAFLAIAG